MRGAAATGRGSALSHARLRQVTDDSLANVIDPSCRQLWAGEIVIQADVTASFNRRGRHK
jgi:hypothetical protein